MTSERDTMRVIVCPPESAPRLSMEDRLDVGFGLVWVQRDGTDVWVGNNQLKKMRSVERQARRRPDAAWTVFFDGPMRGALYERRGRDEWVLVKTTEGFA